MVGSGLMDDATINALNDQEAKQSLDISCYYWALNSVIWENWLVLAIYISTLGKGAAMADPEGEILTLEEVAAYLKAGKRTVYRLAQDGKIPAFKLGGSWRFRRAELDRWIAASIENPQKQGER
jgi:excisionase family DNA binding protein